MNASGAGGPLPRPVGRPVPRLLQWPLNLWLCVQLLWLALGSLLWNLLALLMLPLLPRLLALRLGRAGIAYGYRLFWAIARASGLMRLEAQALDALRDEPGLIIAANHPSMLDAVMLAARLPRAACVMKASLLRNVFLGAAARLAHYISNASGLVMVREAVADLRAGHQLLLFPEGTRSTQAPVNDFTGAVTTIARLAPAPIQTVFIDTDSPYLGKGWPLWRLPPLPIVFQVRLGPRFDPPADSSQALAALQACFEAGVRRSPLPPAPPAHTGPDPGPDPGTGHIPANIPDTAPGTHLCTNPGTAPGTAAPGAPR